MIKFLFSIIIAFEYIRTYYPQYVECINVIEGYTEMQAEDSLCELLDDFDGNEEAERQAAEDDAERLAEHAVNLLLQQTKDYEEMEETYRWLNLTYR